ncbi:MAG: sigma 54-interacting transcriptional regulator [Acidobacteria bacterium]|nr:sigma 54-interacting transcriptional regulator [Acidobacteriota bacterium]
MQMIYDDREGGQKRCQCPDHRRIRDRQGAIANAIHFNSLRSGHESSRSTVPALPKELIEAELFGYVKGAFTGAKPNRTGLISQAKGGSLLLDEIGEMPTEFAARYCECSRAPVSACRFRRDIRGRLQADLAQRT